MYKTFEIYAGITERLVVINFAFWFVMNLIYLLKEIYQLCFQCYSAVGTFEFIRKLKLFLTKFQTNCIMWVEKNQITIQ